MRHPLLDADQIEEAPRSYLDSIGEVFRTFGAPTQDSGNLSYGVRVGERPFFVKTTDPDAATLLDFTARVELLRNAIRISHRCSHRVLPRLINVIESAAGPMLVYEWVDGELLRKYRDQPRCAHERFRQLPLERILGVLDEIFDLHRVLAAMGLVAVDFYDGCLIYDFDRAALHVVDLDGYRQGAFVNSMGRMFGSSRFMAPEEFEHGRRIDQRTTGFTLGRTAAVFLSGGTLDRTRFPAGDELYEVVERACRPLPQDRPASVGEFCQAWLKARQAAG